MNVRPPMLLGRADDIAFPEVPTLSLKKSQRA